jgi:hypothetical protein
VKPPVEKFLYSDGLRKLLPSWLKQWVKRKIPYADFRSGQLRREAETRFQGPVPESGDYGLESRRRIGIIRDSSYAYTYHVAACMELHVPFKVIDIMRDDWLEQVEKASCDAFMAVPPALLNIRRHMFEERFRILSSCRGKIFLPTFDELYIWESKRRMHNWLLVHSVPHPRTRVFFDRDRAIEFCKNAQYPVVHKLDAGAGAGGIYILRRPAEALSAVRRAFGRGLTGRCSDARNREWGSILFQDYIRHDYEWRIVRIGKTYLCRRKIRVGDFASGSGKIEWAEPLPGMLDFVKQVTDKDGFRCMALDVFENPSGTAGEPFLVNELQAIIGFSDVPDNSHTGRWVYTPSGSIWSFEPGHFHRNRCANLRLKLLLEDLDEGRDRID